MVSQVQAVSDHLTFAMERDGGALLQVSAYHDLFDNDVLNPHVPEEGYFAELLRARRYGGRSR